MNRQKHSGVPGRAIRLDAPQLSDGAAVHQLVLRCPPLDANSAYCYFLLCSHFSATCVVARNNGAVHGFLSAYRQPERPDTLFIWQLAVDAALRGHGLAGRMLEHLLQRPTCAGIHYLETTVAPNNHASRQVFQRLAAAYYTGIDEREFLSAEHFTGKTHAEERLLRIGPLTPASPSSIHLSRIHSP